MFKETTLSTKAQVSKKISVIVRSWGDEPVILTAIDINQKTQLVQLFGRNINRPIHLPMEIVFDYEEIFFNKLKKAFDKGKTTELALLYEERKMDTNSCNKYKDMFCSLHEKGKEITDSECTQASHSK